MTGELIVRLGGRLVTSGRLTPDGRPVTPGRLAPDEGKPEGTRPDVSRPEGRMSDDKALITERRELS